MKFTTYTTFPEQTSNESLWVLVDSEQPQSNINTYQINNLESVLTATQFKGNFNETLPLFGQISNQPHSQLLGLGKQPNFRRLSSLNLPKPLSNRHKINLSISRLILLRYLSNTIIYSL